MSSEPGLPLGFRLAGNWARDTGSPPVPAPALRGGGQGWGMKRGWRAPVLRRGRAEWGGIETRAPGTAEVPRGDGGARKVRLHVLAGLRWGRCRSVARAWLVQPRGRRKGQVCFYGSARAGRGRKTERVRNDGEALRTSCPHCPIWALRPRVSSTPADLARRPRKAPVLRPC